MNTLVERRVMTRKLAGAHHTGSIVIEVFLPNGKLVGAAAPLVDRVLDEAIDEVFTALHARVCQEMGVKA